MAFDWRVGAGLLLIEIDGIPLAFIEGKMNLNSY
jgi:hypothetical protein